MAVKVFPLPAIATVPTLKVSVVVMVQTDIFTHTIISIQQGGTVGPTGMPMTISILHSLSLQSLVMYPTIQISFSLRHQSTGTSLSIITMILGNVDAVAIVVMVGVVIAGTTVAVGLPVAVLIAVHIAVVDGIIAMELSSLQADMI